MELFWLLLWKHTNTCWRKEKIDVRVLSHDICILASFLLCFAFWSGESCTRTWKWGGSELLGHPTSFVELRVAFLPSMVLGLISDFIFSPGCGGLKKNWWFWVLAFLSCCLGEAKVPVEWVQASACWKGGGWNQAEEHCYVIWLPSVTLTGWKGGIHVVLYRF